MVAFNVAQLLQEPTGAVRKYTFSERLNVPEDDLRLEGPVEGTARLLRTSRGVLVEATFGTSVHLDCARCLEDALVQVNGTISEEFVPRIDVHLGVPVDTEDNPDLLRIDELHVIDLDDVLRQAILTSLPLRPLCETTCPGLCVTCGARLDSHHEAHAEPIEPVAPPDTYRPFAHLAALLEDADEDGEQAS
jgi:uncharacterized metal-binding protein YceD (DUF177 family)